MNNVMIVIDGSKPLDFDWVSAGIFLEFVPHGESALSGGVALNIDVRGSDSSFVGLSWLIFSDHLGMLFVHRSDQILGHMVYIIERLPAVSFMKFRTSPHLKSSEFLPQTSILGYCFLK